MRPAGRAGGGAWGVGRTPRREQNRKSHGRKEKQTDGRPWGREALKRAPRRERGGESSDEQEGGRVGRAAGRGSGPGLAGGAPTDPCRRLLPSQAALSSPTASVSQR